MSEIAFHVVSLRPSEIEMVAIADGERHELRFAFSLTLRFMEMFNLDAYETFPAELLPDLFSKIHCIRDTVLRVLRLA